MLSSSGDLSFRQGTIVSWSQTTGENTVNVGGTIMANLPVLTMSVRAISRTSTTSDP